MTTPYLDRFWKGLPLAAALCLLLSVGVGCATFDSGSWDERVGTYDIEDAKTELGMPDRTEDLAAGGVIATWIQRSSYSSPNRLGAGTPYSPQMQNQTGVTPAATSVNSSRSSLTLIFNDEGILTGWRSGTE